MEIDPDQATQEYIDRAMQDTYLREIAQRFLVPVAQIPLLPAEIKGLSALIRLGEQIYGNGSHAPAV